MAEPAGRGARRLRLRRPQHSAGDTEVQERAGHDALKHEVARELGLGDDLADPDRLSVREAGKIGGQMVRRLIKEGERRLAEQGPEPDPDGSR